MDVISPEAVVRFAKSNPAVAEDKIIDFLSSERGRDDHGEISADTINNWVKVARALSNRSSELYCRDTVLLSWYLGCESEIVGRHLGSLVSHKRVTRSVIIVIVARMMVVTNAITTPSNGGTVTTIPRHVKEAHPSFICEFIDVCVEHVSAGIWI